MLPAHCIRALLVLAVLALAPSRALAGPPLLCFPLSIGSASSLPWAPGSGWNTPAPSYDRTRLVDDTMAALTPRTPVLVRMETLRRATIYASADAALSARLIDALRARATTTRPADALAGFDLGYATEAMRQMQHAVRITLPVPADDGYALVNAALTAHGRDAAMHYAAALMSIDQWSRGVPGRHLQAAVSGATNDTNLARTLDAHAELWGGRLTSARTAASR